MFENGGSDDTKAKQTSIEAKGRMNDDLEKSEKSTVFRLHLK